MEFLRLIVILFCLIGNYASAYLYPLCFNKERVLSLPDLGFAIFKVEEVIAEEPQIEIESSFVEKIYKASIEIFSPTLKYYGERCLPFIKKIRFFPDISSTQQEKKMESRQNLFYIVFLGIVLTYAILYVYLGKKLCSFYAKCIRSKYSKNLEKFLKSE